MKGFLVLPITFILLLSSPVFAGPYGEYIGTVKTEWLDDGRKMKLLEDFKFIDNDDVEWLAPSGSVVDGASIPKFAWPIIGGRLKANTATLLLFTMYIVKIKSALGNLYI